MSHVLYIITFFQRYDFPRYSIKGFGFLGSEENRKDNFSQEPCSVCPMQSAVTAISGTTAIRWETSLPYWFFDKWLQTHLFGSNKQMKMNSPTPKLGHHKDIGKTLCLSGFGVPFLLLLHLSVKHKHFLTHFNIVVDLLQRLCCGFVFIVIHFEWF